MKRRELERKLRVAGCFLKREGGSHSLWLNPKNGVTEAVPRWTLLFGKIINSKIMGSVGKI
jgi:mRNA interferase HicA